MSRLSIFMVLVAAAPFAAGEASAQETIKIGAVQSMTGSFNPIGKQVMAGARLYLQERGYTMAGKKIEILLKDDTSLPDIGKRLGARAHSQRQSRLDAWRNHTFGSNNSAFDGRSEDPDDCCGFWSFDNGGTLPLHGSYQFHQRPILVRYGRVGDKERCQENCNAGQRLDTRTRSGEGVYRRCRQERRRGRCSASGAVGKSGFCAILAAYPRSQA